MQDGRPAPTQEVVHALNEAIYQESRAQAEAARELLPDAVLNSTATDMGSNVRIWVSPSPLLIHLPYRTAVSAGLMIHPSWQKYST